MRTLAICRVMGRRERAYDLDNLVGGAKPLIDALVRHGYLAGDTPALLTALTVTQRRNDSGDVPCIEIEIGESA
jgi:hypothetical protein